MQQESFLENVVISNSESEDLTTEIKPEELAEHVSSLDEEDMTLFIEAVDFSRLTPNQLSKIVSNIFVDGLIESIEDKRIEEQYVETKECAKDLEALRKEINNKADDLKYAVLKALKEKETESVKIKGLGTFSVQEKTNFSMVDKNGVMELLQEKAPEDFKGLQTINSRSFGSYMKEIFQTNEDLYNELTKDNKVSISRYDDLSYRKSK